MRKALYLCACALLLCLSCRQEGAATLLLARAGQCMEEHPDSALALLSRLPHPERLHGRLQAEYALLLTQARDRNFLDSLQSDSLSRLAVEYYRRRKDDVAAGKALFYHGKVLSLQESRSEEALETFLEAGKRLADTREYKLQGMVQEYIAYINHDQERYDMALDGYRKSASFYEKAGDTLGMAYNYRNMAWLYYNRQQTDSVIRYLEAGTSLIKRDSASPVFPSMLQLQGVVENDRGHHDNAIRCFLAAIEREQVPNSRHYYYMALGNIYMALGRWDEAEACFTRALSSEQTATLSDAYDYLYHLERQRNDAATALRYKELSDSLSAITRGTQLQHALAELQHKHEVEKIRMEGEMRLLKRRLWLTCAGILLLLLLYRTAIGFRRKLAWQKALYDSRLRERDQSHTRELLEKERQLNQYSSQLARMREIQQYDGGLEVIKCLKNMQLCVAELNEQEKEQLLTFTNLLFGDFVTSLSKEYRDLKENDLLLALFIKWGFSTEELATIFDSEYQTIRKRKQRLKEKLGIDKEKLEAFLVSYPQKNSKQRTAEQQA